ncbi:MAG: 2Fe-2S iron-sulfur cluster binding domain-containing protein [Chloroflexaceae bacterium]|nr:2Fe-2S iron-sulfur cluster binding domain-containing protein [Chloroflexaceae bacterium]
MSQTYSAEVRHQGNIYKFSVTDEQTVLQAAEAAGIDLPNSCNAGVCTTCAAQLVTGTVDQSNGMGISPQLQQEGFALLCVSYPRSDLVIEAGKEDLVYDRQFGQTK